MARKKIKDQNGELNIALISDEKYMVPTCVAITSLLENRDPKYNYRIFVVLPDNTSDSVLQQFLLFNVDYPNAYVKPIVVSMAELANLHNNDNKLYLAATETALLKFKLPEIFPDLDKILYLDGDIIVRDSLVSLYHTDLQDNYVAAVRDLPQVLYENQIIGKDIAGEEYFNSGVMLLNLKKMRKNNITQVLIETKRQLTDNTLMDQNVFNIVFKGRVIQCSVLYNACYINLIESRNRYNIEKLNNLYGTSYRYITEMRDDIKIMHFASKLKPWMFYDVPFADEWFYYYKKSIYKDIPIQRIHHTKRDIDIKETKKKVEKLTNEFAQTKNVIPIVFATNKKYAPFVAVAIQSIYETADPNYFYSVNIFMDSELTRNILDKFARIKYENIKISMWDCRHCFDGYHLYSVAHYSKQMYYRWLIPEILSTYKRVIYLDCDLIVNHDIAELYNTDIGENYIGAVNNFTRDNLQNYVPNRLKLTVEKYFNSGVLLIDTEKFLLNKLKNKCLNVIESYDKLACPDQDAINIACKNKIFKLDDHWNFQWHHLFSDACKGEFISNYKQRYRVLKESEPYIIHYTSGIKPWSNPERIYAEYFWQYCKKTAFYEEIIFNQTIENACQNLALSNEGNTVVITRNVKSAAISTNEKDAKIKKLEKEIQSLKHSVSFRVGRLITFIPRKIRNLIKKNRK